MRKKLWNAFTGGGSTIEEHRRKGGNPDVCRIYSYFFFVFEDSDEALMELYDECRKGRRLCGECKKELSERIYRFLEEHERRKERARDRIDRFLLHNKVDLKDLVETAYSMLR